MPFFEVLIFGLHIGTTSFAATSGNAIKACELVVTAQGKFTNLAIPAGHPGAALADGAYCDENGMQIYKKFKALDGTDWTLSLYADRDRHQNTHFIHRIAESGAKEPPQIDLVLNQNPCEFLEKSGTGLTASLKSSRGGDFSIKLSCRGESQSK